MQGIAKGMPVPSTMASLKRHAKAVKKAQGISLGEAQYAVARHFGWPSFRAAQRDLK